MKNLPSILRRIREANGRTTPTPGTSRSYDAKLCEIRDHTVAWRLKSELASHGIPARTKARRLGVSFSVAVSDLTRSREVLEKFLVVHPDRRLPTNRDYDTAFLLIPIIGICTYISTTSPFFPKYTWLGVLCTGISTVIIGQGLQRRVSRRLVQASIHEALTVTAIIAINLVVWRSLF